MRLEQIGRGDRVIDDINESARFAEFADAGEIGDLRARIGDRLDEDEARFRPDGGFDLSDIGGIDEADGDAHLRESFEQARGVAEEETAGDEVVAGAQEREQRRRDGAHAAAEGGGGDAAFHARDLVFERRRRRRALAAVDEAGLLALEDADEVTDIGETEGGRIVDRLVDGPVFDRLGASLCRVAVVNPSAFMVDVKVRERKRQARIVVYFLPLCRAGGDFAASATDGGFCL